MGYGQQVISFLLALSTIYNLDEEPDSYRILTVYSMRLGSLSSEAPVALGLWRTRRKLRYPSNVS